MYVTLLIQMDLLKIRLNLSEFISQKMVSRLINENTEKAKSIICFIEMRNNVWACIN